MKLAGMALIVSVLLVPTGSAEEVKQAGTDPRDFAPKFMPYYRYTELENGLTQTEFTLFGLIALNKRAAFTYEFKLGYGRDITDTDAFRTGSALEGGGLTLPNGLPSEGDGKEAGVGDSNVRFIFRTGSMLGADWLLGSEFDLPTATDPVLGSETMIVAPMVTWIYDMGFWPGPGAFFAGMNFYAFDVWRDTGRSYVNQYRGRWFFMLPLHKSGIYALPEFQPVYDFRTEEFSFWVGPEFGKLLAPGQILYVKPGFGVDNVDNSGDRKWSFEVGFRWFLK